MSINWQQEAEARRTDLLADLQTLLKIPSERDVEHKTADFPLGPNPAKALKTFLALGERDGFSTKNVENVAGRIAYGQGSETLGILGHVDVVPAGMGWQTEPYQPVIKDGKLYARGVADDKGPVMAAYYALKIIKDLNLPLKKQVHFIVGTDEESDWTGMDRYLEVEKAPDFGFSPDAEFPIINGEKGIVSFQINLKPQTQIDQPTLLSFESGLRDNMVPQSAQAKLKTTDAQALEKQLRDFASAHQLTSSMQVQGDTVTLDLIGKGAHALEPQAGRNAATFLATFLKQRDLDTNAQAYLQLITDYCHLDFKGKAFQINHHDDLMGDLTMSPDIFRYQANETGEIVINFRYPKGTSADEIKKQMLATINQETVTITTFAQDQVPHYVPGDDPLVKTLLRVYENQTGLQGHEQVIGGGTFGRMLKRGVAFGAQFPNQPNVMHQPNEFMKIDDLIRATAIYAEAVYELCR